MSIKKCSCGNDLPPAKYGENGKKIEHMYCNECYQSFFNGISVRRKCDKCNGSGVYDYEK